MNEKIKELLLKAEKPARYAGGEFNTPKIKEDAAFKFLMCFPDVYEVGHSNLGIKILYSILNNRPDSACETCFAPWHDMGKLLKENNVPLYSLETVKSMSEFDMLGFSLQYELSYTNVLYMLDLGQIPLYSSERTEEHPLVIAGGPCAVNPMPLSEFIDIFCIGDGENVIAELAEIFAQNKKSGGTKKDFLEKAVKIDGVYVPALNQKTVKRAVVQNLDEAFYPTKIQIPNMEAVHNRSVLELFRGCSRGCRFCQAGMIYRPVRRRKPSTLTAYAEELITNNGYDELSLSSLSTCDYPDLNGLLKQIKPIADRSGVKIALPSTRLDSFDGDIAESFNRSSLTFAPEAGTQRLRDVINKNITEEDILSSCKTAFSRGFSNIKLYFMIGLPTETDEDLQGIVDLAIKIKRLYKGNATAKKPLSLSVSASVFIPKPFTPFQWEPQLEESKVRAAQSLLREGLKKASIKFNWHDSKTSVLEAAYARGGKELGAVILSAYKSGCIFDGWSELFDYPKWIKAFEDNGLDLAKQTGEIDTAAALPWDIIDVGVKKEFLLRERNLAYAAKLTEDCRKSCSDCGITKLTGEPCKW